MKNCPRCKRIYGDDSLNYCLDDGGPLSPLPQQDESATAILPSTSVTDRSDTGHQLPGTRPRLASRSFYLLAGVAILGIITFIVYWNYYSASSHFSSVAVIPFVNESGDPELDYLSDGLTESLISSLSGIPDLKVKARSSVFRFKGKDVDAKTLGTQLGADAIVSGSLSKRGDEITVILELVDPGTGDRRWGGKYSRRISDIISLQGDIARDVSQTLRTKLSGDQQQRVSRNYTANAEAYELYLRGRYHLFKLTPNGIQTGLSYFQQAIELDPKYAPAYVGLAACYRSMVLSTDMPSQEFFPKAKAAAQKAVELDDGLAEAHAVLGFTIFWYDWDWTLSEREFQRALELNPNSADAHWGYGHLLSNTGRHSEALEQIRLARELDPLSLIMTASEGLYLIHAGQLQEGLGRLQKAIEQEPNYWFAHMLAAGGNCDLGNYESAISEASRAKELSQATSMPVAYLGYALARSGRQDDARATLAELLRSSGERYVPPYHIALIYLGLGDRDKTLQSLERGVAERDPKMTFLKVDRKWTPLAADARFQKIMAAVGF